jgi:hypothetical protein
MQGQPQMEPAVLRPLLLAAVILGTTSVAPVMATVVPTRECQAAFANFIPRIVRKSAVAAVDDGYEVRLWGFCRGLEFNDSGNAGGLARTIADNPVLTDPIEERGWSVEDVKFIRIGEGFVDLWLHRNP